MDEIIDLGKYDLLESQDLGAKGDFSSNPPFREEGNEDHEGEV